MAIMSDGVPTAEDTGHLHATAAVSTVSSITYIKSATSSPARCCDHADRRRNVTKFNEG